MILILNFLSTFNNGIVEVKEQRTNINLDNTFFNLSQGTAT